ncbi:MAG TPA: hypothetical protein VKQ30_05865 [Ktedonobacterales bacterium]|nr:hypothetical protein [Ktedonobacterales bacterium]
MSPENTPIPQQSYSVPSDVPATTAPAQVNPNDLARALDQAERKRGRHRLRRRALLTGGGVVAAAAVCAGAVEFGPSLLQKAGEYTKSELDQAFQSGIEAGRQAVLNELKQLEGVSIEAAIDIAGVERFAFDKLVVPLSQLAVTVAGDALSVLASAVQTAHDDLTRVNITVDWLTNLHALLTLWRTNLPDTTVLNAYASYTDNQIQSTETYLRALQQRINAPQSGTPTPTK